MTSANSTRPEQGSARRILLFGATGTIGLATTRALMSRGLDVCCAVREVSKKKLPPGVDIRVCDVQDPASLKDQAFRGQHFDAVVSCMASRTGSPEDARAIDYQAHSTILAAAKRHGVTQFVLLSAICVQKPKLAFQHAKLAFEHELMASGLTYSIVRPTAYFKSLSGQIERVRKGKPFLVFGNGSLTATKPISDRDLADFIAGCLDDTARHNAILPVGGPGPAITPRMQGEMLFMMTGRTPRFTRVPAGFLRGVSGALNGLGALVPRLKSKAEFARIGHYYATESMLVWDADRARYDADATPSHGKDTLHDFYHRVISGNETVDLGEHAMF